MAIGQIGPNGTVVVIRVVEVLLSDTEIVQILNLSLVELTVLEKEQKMIPATYIIAQVIHTIL